MIQRYAPGPCQWTEPDDRGEYVKHEAVAALVADGERMRFLIAALHAAEQGDVLAQQCIEADLLPEIAEDADRETVMQAFRDHIDAMRTKWQPLEWD